MQTPTVGRVVHFFPQGGPPLTEPQAAIVTRVIIAGQVNLATWTPEGVPQVHHSVRFVQPGEAPPGFAYCCWPVGSPAAQPAHAGAG